MPDSFADRNAKTFWLHVSKSKQNECWLWRGRIERSMGYGRMKVLGFRKFQFAHRFSWFLHHGSWPKVIDHLCRNKACVNPSHLEDVTHAINVLRGGGPTAVNARKTHCKNGHPFTKENTYLHTARNRAPYRTCLTCNKKYWYARYKTHHISTLAPERYYAG